jgi:hypothetical protein
MGATAIAKAHKIGGLRNSGPKVPMPELRQASLLLRVLRLTLADEAIERLHLFRLMSLYGHPSVSQILDRLLYYCIQYS